MVAPVGDPDWVALRGDNALTLDGKTPALKLDNFFALNPAMPNFHRSINAGQATIVHAAATPYRERSHFDGQDVLESGVDKPGATDSGWLNRASQRSRRKAARCARRQEFAVGPVTPLVVRGSAPVLSWSPQRIPPASDDTMQAADRSLSSTPIWSWRGSIEGRTGLAAIARADGMDAKTGAASGRDCGTGARLFRRGRGRGGKIPCAADGPRVGALALNGWDTHVNEGVAKGGSPAARRARCRNRRD